jgi:hypothetical protein
MGSIKFTNKEGFTRKPNIKFSYKNDRFIQLSQGNSKLLENDFYAFRIWNISPIKTCPYSTGNCRKYCYAMKSYRLFPATRNLQENNYSESQMEDFTNNMIEFINQELTKVTKKGKKVLFRIHESGDFYSLEYFSKWVKITDYFKNNNDIIFQAYTKSLSFIDSFLTENGRTINSLNIHITSSIWNDTLPENIELTKKLKLQTFTAVTEVPNKSFECKCIDCGNCRQCYQNKVKNIAVKLH